MKRRRQLTAGVVAVYVLAVVGILAAVSVVASSSTRAETDGWGTAIVDTVRSSTHSIAAWLRSLGESAWSWAASLTGSDE